MAHHRLSKRFCREFWVVRVACLEFARFQQSFVEMGGYYVPYGWESNMQKDFNYVFIGAQPKHCFANDPLLAMTAHKKS